MDMATEFPVSIRFRPECVADQEKLESILAGSFSFRFVNPDPAPGESPLTHAIGGMVFEADIESQDRIRELLIGMMHVSDGHRLLQTVDLKDDFTGDAFDGRDERMARILELVDLDLSDPEDDAINTLYHRHNGIDLQKAKVMARPSFP